MKGVMRFGKKDKLSPRYIGPYKIIRRIGQVAYKVELPHELAIVHPVFHLSILRKCLGEPSHVIQTEDIEPTQDLSFEEVPVAILDRQVRKLRSRDIASIKVLWRNQNIEEATSEAEEDMQAKYTYLFQGQLEDSYTMCLFHIVIGLCNIYHCILISHDMFRYMIYVYDIRVFHESGF
ncbi:hypothetical protein MTR67_031139 [Solanum verrucosum]|uniref:Tf2-1-like SH3-like domain-containing protein n=1 Tax=Solanum verrucosum TaxID=315347 RepID=A0AAF0U1Y2_SOLVR|nr:hypothetical protein MTR67_031139 [Solanum verrucosum]